MQEKFQQRRLFRVRWNEVKQERILFDHLPTEVFHDDTGDEAFYFEEMLRKQEKIPVSLGKGFK